MARYGLNLVLVSALGFGQATAPAAPGPAAPKPGNPTAQSAPAEPEVNLPPEAPVITIEGVCEQPPAEKTAAADCKTVITKSQFENAIKALQPTLPPAAQRRQFASRYAMLVIFADQAHKQGVDKGPKFDEQMKLTRMEVAARALGQEMQEKAATVSDAEVTDYFQQHASNYEQADVQQIFVPHAKAPQPPTQPGAAPVTAKAPAVTEEGIRKEVEGLYKRAAAGEDFAKLQAEAYTFSGLKTKPPDTKVKDLRRSTLTPNRAVVFEMKPGEVSKVVTDPTGYFIYKLDKKDSVPMGRVRADIENTLKTQKMQAAIQTMQHSATPKFDDKYFGPEAAPMAVPGPGPNQPPMRPAPSQAPPPPNK
jgi:hypothetical protein